MHKVYRWFIVSMALLTMVFGMSLTASAQSAKPQISVPVITLKNWNHSSQHERYSFLVGFLSMVDIEQAWQGMPALPVSKSLNGLWTRGLSGVPIPELCATIDNYIAAHPGEMDRPVLEVIGRLYISPKLSDAEKKAAEARYNMIRDDI